MKKDTAKEIVSVLSGVFTDKPALKYETPYQLLVAVMLSAQCTDERVNRVTEILFKEHGTPQRMAKLKQEELEKYIFSCGLYKSKSAHVLSATNDIIKKYGGEVPRDLAELRTLAGVGRKTANVVYSVAFGGNAIAVDTHVFRVSKRIGLASGKNVLTTEKELMTVLDEKDWSRAHHYLIYLGRSFCKAANPDCKNCPIEKLCKKSIDKR